MPGHARLIIKAVSLLEHTIPEIGMGLRLWLFLFNLILGIVHMNLAYVSIVMGMRRSVIIFYKFLFWSVLTT